VSHVDDLVQPGPEQIVRACRPVLLWSHRCLRCSTESRFAAAGKSKIEIAGFWAVKPQSPAISNAAATGKQTPNQVLGGLFTDNYRPACLPSASSLATALRERAVSPRLEWKMTVANAQVVCNHRLGTQKPKIASVGHQWACGNSPVRRGRCAHVEGAPQKHIGRSGLRLLNPGSQSATGSRAKSKIHEPSANLAPRVGDRSRLQPRSVARQRNISAEGRPVAGAAQAAQPLPVVK
jgi:hypothetical protein